MAGGPTRSSGPGDRNHCPATVEWQEDPQCLWRACFFVVLRHWPFTKRLHLRVAVHGQRLGYHLVPYQLQSPAGLCPIERSEGIVGWFSPPSHCSGKGSLLARG